MRLATGAPITVIKRVVKFYYTLKDLQCEDDFIVLDLDDKFDVILGRYTLAQKARAKNQLAASIRKDACHLFIRWPSDERLEASTSVWMSYE